MSKLVAIDLGTSTSEVAVIVDGKPFIINNTLGKPVTPSVVHIREDGSTLVGEEAAEYLLTRPDCTFIEVKRMTGNNTPLSVHDKSYSPEELQAILLRYLVSCAEDFLGESVSRAVITVPAYFTDVQRRATAKAGELAGLYVERIINEPTAAALDYGLDNFDQCKNILIYDFGGGTLDITVLELFDGVIDVKASHGNNSLGGKDFDELIMNHLADPGSDPRARMRLKKAAEECKIALSSDDSFDVSLPFLFSDKNGNPVSVEKTITRSEFDALIEELVASTRTLILSTLSDARLSPDELDVVLLVGGTTRIPLVRKLVKDTLNIEPLSALDPELAVVRGAAVQAGILDGLFTPEQEIILTDVCPYTLGIASMVKGIVEDKFVCFPIITRNTTIPVERSDIFRTYGDYQTAVNIEVYQGDSPSPDNNEYLGNLRLSGIPPARRGKEEIEVIFSYDVNGILQVRALSLSTRNEVSAEINTAGVQPKPTIDIDLWNEAPNARRHRPLIRKAEKLLNSIHDLYDLQVTLTLYKEAIVLQDEDDINMRRSDLIDILDEIEEVL